MTWAYNSNAKCIYAANGESREEQQIYDADMPNRNTYDKKPPRVHVLLDRVHLVLEADVHKLLLQHHAEHVVPGSDRANLTRDEGA